MIRRRRRARHLFGPVMPGTPIIRKIGLLFFAPALATLVALGIFVSHFVDHQNAAAFVNAAGRQRMLLHELLREAEGHVREQQPDARGHIRRAAAGISEHIEAIRNGGEVNGRPVPAAPADLRAEVDAFQEIWTKYRDAALAIIDSDESETITKAYSYLNANIGPATKAADNIVRAYEVRNAAAQQRMLQTLSAVAVLSFASLVLGTLVISRYSEDRRKTETALEREKENAQKYLDVAGVMLLALDRDERVQLVNQRGCTILGGLREEIIGKNWFDTFVPQTQREQVRSLFQSMFTGKEYKYARYENAVLTSSGEERTIAWNNTVLKDAAGKTIATLSSGEDITEYKRARRALEESRERFQSLVEATSDWIWEVDERGRYTYASPKVRELLGYEPDEVIGKTPFDFMPREEAERVRTEFENRRREKKPFDRLENINLHRDGSKVVLETSGTPIIEQDGRLRGYRGIDRDVTDRKRALDALEENEELFRQLMENIYEVFFVRDIPRTRMLYVSPAYEEIWGRPVQALYDDPMDFLKIVHPGDHDRVLEALRNQDEGHYFNEEYRILRADGTMRWIRARTFPVRNAAGEVYRIAGLAGDVTTQKSSEEKLRESEAKYRALMEHAADPIVLADLNGRLIDANRRAQELLGYTREEITQLHVRDIHPPSELPRVWEAFQRVSREGSGIYQDGHVLRRDGSTVQVEIVGSVVEYGGRRIAQGIFRVTEERKRAELQRREREKKHREALVREVHHRIKNNLQGLVGLLGDALGQQPELREPLERSIRQIQSIALVHGLQSQRPDAGLILGDIVPTIAGNAERLMNAEVSLGPVPPEVKSLWIAEEEAVPIALILNELIVNALKHAPGGKPERAEIAIEATPNGARIQILTPGGKLSPGFDFRESLGLGTGLELVKALLPHGGASLDIRQTARGTVTELVLASPVVGPSPM